MNQVIMQCGPPKAKCPNGSKEVMNAERTDSKSGHVPYADEL